MSAALRMAVWMVALALIALPVVALIHGWIGAERWPLRTLRVQGAQQRVDAAQVRAAVQPFAARGYFAAPLEDTRAAVEALPWVRAAHVQKRWPDVLEVRIDEYAPFARWGSERLISEDGRIFPMQGALREALPHLDGPDTRVGEVVAFYNRTQALFAPHQRSVRRLHMDARGSWTLQLDSGVQVIVGRMQAERRLQRFARLLPRVQTQDPRVLQRADLRYTNGFALVWNPPVHADPRAARVALPLTHMAMAL